MKLFALFIALCVLFSFAALPIVFAHTDVGDADGDGDEQCAPADPVSAGLPLFVVIIYAMAIVFIVLAAYQHNNPLFIIFGVLFFIAGAVSSWYALELNSYTIYYGVPGSTHVHADFAVMVNNQLVDLNNERYLSYIGNYHSRFVHIHDADYVVHSHATGATWDYFFKTIGVSLNDTCITVQGEPVCNGTILRNGEPMTGTNFVIEEGDRVLFHYGTGDPYAFFDQAVGNNSCLHSGTCPERGVLPGCSVTPTTE